MRKELGRGNVSFETSPSESQEYKFKQDSLYHYLKGKKFCISTDNYRIGRTYGSDIFMPDPESLNLQGYFKFFMINELEFEVKFLKKKEFFRKLAVQIREKYKLSYEDIPNLSDLITDYFLENSLNKGISIDLDKIQKIEYEYKNFNKTTDISEKLYSILITFKDKSTIKIHSIENL